MTKDNSFLITKPEIKFWLAIIAIVVSGVCTFVTLRMRVEAMYDKGTQLRKEVEIDRDLLHLINDRTIRMETNLITIMKAFKIEVIDNTK